MIDRRQFLSLLGSLASVPPFAAELVSHQNDVVIGVAELLLGVPSVTPALDFPRTTDASSLTCWAYKFIGISLPPNAFLQHLACIKTRSHPGGLVFFGTIEDLPHRVSHLA